MKQISFFFAKKKKICNSIHVKIGETKSISFETTWLDFKYEADLKTVFEY